MAQVSATLDEPVTGHDSEHETDREETSPKQRGSKRSKLPKINVSPRDTTLYEWFDALTEDDWARVMVYFYRVSPRIVREPSNIYSIDKVKPEHPINKEWILEEFGSGKYKIQVNDADMPKDKRLICNCYPDYHDPERPPKVDARELDVDYKGNRLIVERFIREGKLTPDRQPVVHQPSESAEATMAQAMKEVAIEAMKQRGAGGDKLESQAMGKMMDMMATASNKSIEIALGQVKKDDPAAIVALLASMKDLLGGSNQMAPVLALLTTLVTEMIKRPEKPATDPVVDMLRDELKAARSEAAEERKRAHEMQMKMFEQRQDQANPMTMIDQVLTITEKVSGLGGGGGRAQDWKSMAVEEGMKQLPDILNVFRMFANRPREAAPRPAAPAAIPGPGAVPRPAPVQTMPSPAPASTTENPAPPASVAAAAPAAPEPAPDANGDTLASDPEVLFIVEVLKARGGDMVQMFGGAPNREGGEDAADLTARYAPAIYERMKRAGKERIMAAIARFPAMVQDIAQIGSAEMFMEFLDGFIAGPPPDDDEDADEPGAPDEVPAIPRPAEPRPVPVAAKPKGGKAKTK